MGGGSKRIIDDGSIPEARRFPYVYCGTKDCVLSKGKSYVPSENICAEIQKFKKAEDIRHSPEYKALYKRRKETIERVLAEKSTQRQIPHTETTIQYCIVFCQNKNYTPSGGIRQTVPGKINFPRIILPNFMFALYSVLLRKTRPCGIHQNQNRKKRSDKLWMDKKYGETLPFDKYRTNALLRQED